MNADGAKIVVDHVSKDFDGGSGRVRAVDDVELRVADGEFVTVVGPSGCGKTTLLNIIAGLEPPDTGTVIVDGRPVTGPGPERGVIFQQYALFPWMTVWQNVEFGLRLARVPKAERRQRIEHYLKLVGLETFARALPKELSGGMKQRCAIARAYAVNPVILLLDEPFGALDAQTKVRMQEELQEMWRIEKKTVFFITHDVEEAVYLGNRVVVMSARPGRVLMDIKVDLAVPRSEEVRLSADFLTIKNQVWRAVYHKAVGSEEPERPRPALA